MATVNILSITSLQFRLPDGFDGDIADALRELANYHDSVSDQPTSTVGYVDKAWYDMPYKHVNMLAFDNFIDAIRDGRRMHGLFKINKCELSDVEEING